MALTLQSGQSGSQWEGAGHAIEGAWLELAGSVGGWVLVAVFALVTARALLRRGRYRAVEVLGEPELARLHEELVAAEKRTVGEVLPVVVERSDRHPAAHWMAAATAVALGCVLLAGQLPWDRPLLFLGAQLLLGAVGFGLSARLPDVQRLFISGRRARETAEEQAFQEFYRAGLHETKARTGVLLFVSLLEHRVVVLADEGIAAKVDADHWKTTDAAVLDGIAAGSLRDGLIAGIRRAASVLAEHFPWESEDENEVPDRIVVRRE